MNSSTKQYLDSVVDPFLGAYFARRRPGDHQQSKSTIALVDLFVVNQLRVALAMPLLALLFVGFTFVWVDRRSGLMWLATILICQGLQLLVCRGFERAKVPLSDDADAGRWVGRLAVTEFLYALAWASALLYFWSATNGALNVLVIAMLLVAVAVRLIIASNCLLIVIAGTAPIAMAIALRCLLEADAFYLGLAALVILAELYFLHLAGSLQQTAHDMLTFKAQNDTLIEELAREKSEADEARHRAEAANSAKSRFLATMSHELRTPLNAILGFSEIVKTEMLGPVHNKTYKSYAGDIHRSGQHLLSLINEILDLSRIEAGRYELHEEVISLADVGREVSHLLTLKADERGVQLVERFEQGLPDMIGDQRAVRQIWINLLSNAIKFSPRGGAVTLKTSLNSAGGLQLSVSDRGPGIPQTELPHVLTPFGQGTAVTKLKEGVGLGLPIVRGLPDLHDASLEIKSREGKGTTAIIVNFPATRIIDDTPVERRPLVRPTSGQRLLMAVTR